MSVTRNPGEIVRISSGGNTRYDRCNGTIVSECNDDSDFDWYVDVQYSENHNGFLSFYTRQVPFRDEELVGITHSEQRVEVGTNDEYMYTRTFWTPSSLGEIAYNVVMTLIEDGKTYQDFFDLFDKVPTAFEYRLGML